MRRLDGDPRRRRRRRQTCSRGDGCTRIAQFGFFNGNKLQQIARAIKLDSSTTYIRRLDNPLSFRRRRRRRGRQRPTDVAYISANGNGTCAKRRANERAQANTYVYIGRQFSLGRRTHAQSHTYTASRNAATCGGGSDPPAARRERNHPSSACHSLKLTRKRRALKRANEPFRFVRLVLAWPRRRRSGLDA